MIATLLLGLAAALPQDESPIAAQLARANAALDEIAAIPAEERTFDNTPNAMDGVIAELFRTARMPGFLGEVSTDAAERARGREADSDLSEWFIDFNKRQDLYVALKRYAAAATELTPLEQRLVDRMLRDFRREGMELGEDERAQLLEIDQRLNELGIEFQKNIADDETLVPLTREELAGVPEDFLDSLPTAGGLVLCEMKGPVISRILDQCDDESTRLKVVIAYGRRAGQRNVEVLEEMLRLRSEKAEILGYPSIAAYNVETRMARSPEAVFRFYEELRPKLREKALADFQEYQDAKREHLGDPEARLQAWDVSYYGNYLRRTRYAVDSEELREYFPLEAVTEGLFSITQSLYGVRYTDVTEEARAAGEPVWHEDVRLYEVSDAQTGEQLGAFYIDLHPRAGKYTHAAQFPLVLRKEWPNGEVTLPKVALVCNFTKPTAGKPALLSHDEVETYFHEFGHCLHSVFTRSPYAYFAGTQVARDFVEAPSQMFENWVWEADVLRTFARHYETGAPIPDELVAGMVEARNLGSGISAEGQVFLGLLDMRYHTAAGGELDTTAVRQEVYSETRTFEPLEHTFGQASFGHLVHYDAGYYGYLWSLVYAADMFGHFEELGLLNPEAGQLYREAILARGGTMDELDMVRQFLGRDARPDAFLRHLGLEE